MRIPQAQWAHIRQDFIDRTLVFGGFPSRESLQLLGQDGVRYAVVHLDLYRPDIREALQSRMREFEAYLKPRYVDGDVRLYEIVAAP